MNLLNLHEHPIVKYIYQSNNFVKEEVLLKGELSEISCNDLYCIICEKCNDLYNDFNSKYQLQNRNGSLFGTKDVIEKYKSKNLIIFEFLKFDNSFLMGTKNEIISELLSYYEKKNDKSKEKMQRVIELELVKKNFDSLSHDSENQKSENEDSEKELEEVEKEKIGLSRDLEDRKTDGQKTEKNLEPVMKEKKKQKKKKNKKKK